MKSKILSVTMALGLVLFGLGVSIATAAAPGARITPPAVGKQTTIGELLRLINGQSQQTGHIALPSQFNGFCRNGGKVPMTVAEYKGLDYVVDAKGKVTTNEFVKLNSVQPRTAQDKAGTSLANVLTMYADDATPITLQAPTDAHIKALLAKERVTGAAATAAAARLKKVMLYFEYKNFALFIFDPWVANVVNQLSRWNA